MNNRREFFKVLGSIAAGVVGAKVSSYIPKKEDKEELMVSEHIIFTDNNGNTYNPIVVAKKPTKVEHITQSSSSLHIYQPTTPQIRKLS